jgi:ATP-dependent Lon protease
MPEISVTIEDKQTVLSQSNPDHSWSLMSTILKSENDILGWSRHLSEGARQIDKNQREYYLREQLKVISGRVRTDSASMILTIIIGASKHSSGQGSGRQMFKEWKAVEMPSIP